MTSSGTANRYAQALADAVTSETSTIRAENALAELRFFEAALKGSPDLQNALITPAVSGSRKKAVVGKIADQLEVSRITRNFVYVLIDHRRITLLTEILHRFELILEERSGFARADVTSARDLSEQQRDTLNAQLEKLTGKKVRMRFAVDNDLIGGLVARIGSTVYDGSVRGQLQSIGRRLGAEG